VNEPARILLVDDDVSIQRAVAPLLRSRGYHVDVVGTGAEGVAAAVEREPDLIVLDLGLPDLEGVEVCRRMRDHSKAPIVILSARSEEAEKVAALDLGADDYVAKPFAVGELLARIRAALRRSIIRADGAGSIVHFGPVEVDLEKRIVRLDGDDVHLTPNEYKLLQVLIQHTGKVLTQRQLLNEVWGPQHTEQAQYLRVYIAQLRRKLERDPARPKYLQTEPGVGYRLVPDE